MFTFSGQTFARIFVDFGRQHSSGLDRLEDLRPENLRQVFFESESRLEAGDRGPSVEHVRASAAQRTRLQIEVKQFQKQNVNELLNFII